MATMEWETTSVESVYEEIIDDWIVTWTLAKEDGCYIVRSVAVNPVSDETPQDGITSQWLRKLSPSRACAAFALRELGYAEYVRNVIDGTDEALKVQIPEGRSYPDTFYKEVACRFLAFGATNNGAALAIARANGVPGTTAHRWVKEARQRGFLPVVQR